MIWKLSYRNVKRSPLMSGLIVLLLVILLLLVMSMVSALEVKLENYLKIKPYLQRNGAFIVSSGLKNPNTNELFENSEELCEAFPSIKEVLSVSESKQYCIGEQANFLNVWCYSPEVMNVMSPIMEDGRWFSKKDKESNQLKGVISYNENGITVGDVVTLKHRETGETLTVEIIGVMRDKESVYYHNSYAMSKGDYRECFYNYGYKMEGNSPVIILYENDNVKNLQMGGTLITFHDNANDQEMKHVSKQLMSTKTVSQYYELREMHSNSIKYIRNDMYRILPLFVCVFVLVIIATLSVCAVSVKRGLKHYALYYICGMQWSYSGIISGLSSVWLAGVAFVLTMGIMLFLEVKNVLGNSVLHFGVWQVCASVIVLVIYIFVSWILPNGILRRASAREILVDNSYM